jgi:hypothetical protein
MDGAHIRVLASRARELAGTVSAAADRVTGAAEVSWTSPAASEYRRRVEVERARVLQAAGLLDDAARSLLHHAAALDEVAASPRVPAWPPTWPVVGGVPPGGGRS